MDLGSRDLKGQDKLNHVLEKGKKTRPSDGPTQANLQQFLNLPQSPSKLPGDLSQSGLQQTIAEKKSTLNPNTRPTNQEFSQRSGQIYTDVSNHLAGQPQPFTAAWYADHPQAWQYTHPHADAWVAATWGAVTGWVAGVATTPVSYGYSESVVYVQGEPAPTTSAPVQAQQAQQLSQSYQAASDEQWMPLGVYALVQEKDTKAQMLMQLSISQSGKISGSYYNVLSDNSQPLHGSLDLKTQQAAWSIAENSQVVFQTDLNSLTQAEAPVLVHYGDGESQQWTLVRLPNDE